MVVKNVTFLVVLVSALSILNGCGGPATPEDLVDHADRAVDAEDYQAAYDNYQQVVHWKGEGTVPQGLRFKAALESVKCQAHLKKGSEAAAAFVALERVFPQEMAKGHEKALQVCTSLGQADEIDAMIEVLKYAGAKYPDQKEGFSRLVEETSSRMSDDQLAELRKLGYL